ncbi:MAG TPA: response regulator [Chloroflexi bacterium]|nr:response regulator [Chloroflexota bacterium]
MSTEAEYFQARIDELTARLAACEAQLADAQAANAELERAAHDKDELLATMGHELRTPLTAVLSLSRVLQEQLGQVLTERQQQSFQVINASGQHLLELINDILDLSKLQAGKMMLKLEPVGVETLCTSALDIVRQLAEEKHLRLSLHIDPKVSTIQADRLRIKQILVNLLSNAVKFTPAYGAVGIDVVSDSEHERMRLTVWDTGIGIAADDLPNLFKPFVQLEHADHPPQLGTGLGLALSQRLARQHGGDITVTSAPGVGSRFVLELPWVSGDVARPSATPPPPPSSSVGDRRRLILLAEDNEANIFAISEYLELYGIPVIVARTGPEALEAARTQHPGLILMDINLPRLDGLEVIRRIRSLDGYSDLPIAIITALSASDERVQAAGADHYLGKPLDLDRLDQILDQYFAKP